MCQLELNHLMILNIYKELIDDLDMNLTANEFVHCSEHSLSAFGKFGD